MKRKIFLVHEHLLKKYCLYFIFKNWIFAAQLKPQQFSNIDLHSFFLLTFFSAMEYFVSVNSFYNIDLKSTKDLDSESLEKVINYNKHL